MKMTEKEIAEEYLKCVKTEGFSSTTFCQNMAMLNDCMPSEIKEILENQDVLSRDLENPVEGCTEVDPQQPPKRAGRPKMSEDEKLEAKLDKAAKTIKELREIPSSVEIVVNERIEVLKSSIEAHQRMIDKNTKELSELEEFLDARYVRDM